MPAIPTVVTRVLREYRAALERAFGERLRKLVLFGSVARAEAHEDSDVDVLVVIEALSFRERSRDRSRHGDRTRGASHRRAHRVDAARVAAGRGSRAPARQRDRARRGAAVTGGNRDANARAKIRAAEDALKVAGAALAIAIVRDAMSRPYYAAFHAARALVDAGSAPVA